MITQERQAELNHKHFLAGTVRCSNGHELLCFVKDMSPLGANINVEDFRLVSDQFMLAIDEDPKPRACKVVSRLGRKLGIAFVAPPPVMMVRA